VANVTVRSAHQTSPPEPAQQPPKVVHLPVAESSHPGRARLVLTLAGPDHPDGSRALVVPVRSDRAVRLAAASGDVEGVGPQRVSQDGRYLLQMGRSATGPGMVVIDLRSGHERVLPNFSSASGESFGELSPDDATVAVRDDKVLTLVDVETGRKRRLLTLSRRPASETETFTGAQLGWSPSGELLVVRRETDTAVVDLRGRVRARFPGASPTNGSQSWAPDGQSILLYDATRSAYLIASVDGGDPVQVTRPADAQAPLGSAGDRIVWMAGSPGSQRLITTDDTGREQRPWTTVRVGARPVESVTWSRALSG
jgi:hypothetical protein